MLAKPIGSQIAEGEYDCGPWPKIMEDGDHEASCRFRESVGGLRGPCSCGPTATKPEPRGSLLDPTILARFFHETYEDNAPDRGYESRWFDLPAEAKQAMITTCLIVLNEMRRQGVVTDV